MRVEERGCPQITQITWKKELGYPQITQIIKSVTGGDGCEVGANHTHQLLTYSSSLHSLTLLLLKSA
jgi:hypothetical protein